MNREFYNSEEDVHFTEQWLSELIEMEQVCDNSESFCDDPPATNKLQIKVRQLHTSKYVFCIHRLILLLIGCI